MDMPTKVEDESFRNGDLPGPPDGLNSSQKSLGPAKADDARRDEDNKFQSAISAWRGIAFVSIAYRHGLTNLFRHRPHEACSGIRLDSHRYCCPPERFCGCSERSRAEDERF